MTKLTQSLLYFDLLFVDPSNSEESASSLNGKTSPAKSMHRIICIYLKYCVNNLFISFPFLYVSAAVFEHVCSVILFQLIFFLGLSGQVKPDCNYCKDNPNKSCKHCACHKVLHISLCNMDC